MFADVVDAQPHEQLAEQLTQNLGQINKAMNGGGGGSASSSSAAAAMDEDKSGIKRKDKAASEDTKSPPRAKAKGMAKQTPDS